MQENCQVFGRRITIDAPFEEGQNLKQLELAVADSERAISNALRSVSSNM
jgi:hypothetical protein